MVVPIITASKYSSHSPSLWVAEKDILRGGKVYGVWQRRTVTVAVVHSVVPVLR